MTKRANILTQMGARNDALEDRQKDDFYATEPKAVELLLGKESFNNGIWEPACGQGHIAEVFKGKGYNVRATDLVDRGYGENRVDFLFEFKYWGGDIVTNPPFKLAKEFVYKSMELLKEGNKLAMFLKIQFLEGQERLELFKKYPPKRIYVASQRLNCAKDGDFEKYTSSAMCYAWIIWEKGNKELPTLDWI